MAERAVPLLAVLLPAPPCANPWFLESRLDRDGLRVSLQDRATLRTWRVEFVEVEGVRQLDAGDLLEFWPACAAAQGWLYRIEQGGWLDQECRRAGFVARETKAIEEYFINAGDRCLNVLSWSPPKVSASN
ncbi:TPA: hypothetical protein L6B08_16065 [Pseudomonas aeruginosa]|uniref:hypothetical protein n=1 Tax=Pseudomonas aeruginosa group TaxID=136841 RepID=UPI00053E8C99|nr:MULTISPECIES: hypothetical protein [Pseudomonas aeruginosa group]KAB0750575.1 hypothetical protein F7O94_05100 [Pseudomonas aeruginosa]KSR48257.1 hypothetical protein APB45_05985 [Pseudomonas aeruginosa]MBG5600807.1 hypothetical protein [Pseudomonas aeruginosa]MBG5754553.1 hypothetical protein [Pseudomonas aeruginosa]MBH3672085.1 hypothetical protein [Pseudomonas aeruginosa]